MRVRLNKNTAEVVRLRNLAKRISDQADNLSPTNNVHPAPLMRQWVQTVIDIAQQLEAK
jgi:hypothetical protein